MTYQFNFEIILNFKTIQPILAKNQDYPRQEKKRYSSRQDFFYYLSN